MMNRCPWVKLLKSDNTHSALCLPLRNTYHAVDAQTRSKDGRLQPTVWRRRRGAAIIRA
jgi:hypothetical protein